jgi:galactokinase
VLGARLSGAGFGGCVVALVRAGAEERAIAHVSEVHARAFGREPSARVLRVAGGLRVEEET